MNYSTFEPLLSSWGRLFKPFIESPEMDKIYNELKSRKGKVRTLPLPQDTYKAFQLCNYDNLRCILVGFCPYHTIKNDTVVADGLAFSCSKLGVLQSSLQTFYDGVEKDIFSGLNLNMDRNPDLSFLAEQGVLLYNVALTTQENKAGSDVDLWAKFNEFFWLEIINKYFRSLPIVFFGNVAQKSEKLLTPFLHWSKVVAHPASISYSGGTWDTGGLFQWINNLIEQNNDKEYTIKWDSSIYKPIDVPF